jgi:hypothetical protein
VTASAFERLRRRIPAAPSTVEVPHGPRSWRPLERALGVDLPDQFKAFVEAFGYGARPPAPHPIVLTATLLELSHRSIVAALQRRRIALPQMPYPHRDGLLLVGVDPWGEAVGLLPEAAGDGAVAALAVRDGSWHRHDGCWFEFWLRWLDRGDAPPTGPSLSLVDRRAVEWPAPPDRPAELAALQAIWRRARTGPARTVALAGEHAADLSDVVTEFLASDACRDAAVTFDPHADGGRTSRALQEHRPLIVVVEDALQATEATRRSLTEVVGPGADHPVLLLLGWVTGDRPPGVSALDALDAATRHWIRSLPRLDVLTLRRGDPPADPMPPPAGPRTDPSPAPDRHRSGDVATENPATDGAVARCRQLLDEARTFHARWWVDEMTAAASEALGMAAGLGDTELVTEAALACTEVALRVSAADQAMVDDVLHRIPPATAPARAVLDGRRALVRAAADARSSLAAIESAWRSATDLASDWALAQLAVIRWMVGHGLADTTDLASMTRVGLDAAERHRARTGRAHPKQMDLEWWDAVGRLHRGDRPGFEARSAALAQRAREQDDRLALMSVAYGRASLALAEGDAGRAREWVAQARRDVRWDQLTGMAIDQLYDSSTLRLHGRWGELADSLEPLAKLPTATALRLAVAAGRARSGQVAEARALFDQLRRDGLAPTVENCLSGVRPVAAAFFADLVVELDERGAAPAALDLLDPYRGTVMFSNFYMAPLQAADVYRGRLLLLAGDREAAHEALEAGTELERALGGRALTVCSGHPLALARLAVGDVTGAAAAAESALADAHELGLSHDAHRLATLWAAIRSASPPRPRGSTP